METNINTKTVHDWNLDDEEECWDLLQLPRGDFDSLRGRLLWRYAVNRIAAFRERRAGNIGVALDYEATCDLIYKQMPVDIRW